MDWRPAFYRLQQRLALTNRELNTLAAILALMAAGVVIRHVRHGLMPYNADYYDTYFAHLDTLGNGPDSAAVSPANPPAPHTERREITSSQTPPPPLTEPLSINRATAAELEQLPRIGPRTAERIVAFREANGPFRRVEDLLQIKGIGEKTLDGLRPHVVVD